MPSKKTACIPVAIQRKSGKDRRAALGRRKRIEPRVLRNSHGSVDGANYNSDQIEFMLALDTYKRDMRRPFPTCHEVLDVLLALGYRKLPDADTPIFVKRR